MRTVITRRTIVRALVAAGLLVTLGGTFAAYQNPAHTAQWLSLLQLCR